MANDAKAMGKQLRKRGYRVEPDTKRGACSYLVIDPNSEQLVARFPVSPSPGSWRKNLLAAITRYERTGVPARSKRITERGVS
ncbi:MAG TPA: hypothetical protein VKZ89_17915 [Thermobifida alba]|nr:hypothetical protein [Thermobifida alba]